MTRTLITGVAGFTGRYMAELLSQQGHEVHGIVHAMPEGAVRGAERLYEANLADLSAVDRIVNEVRPDQVVHLAAIAFVAHSAVEQMYSANILGTRQLLESLAKLPNPPRSTLLASSANVYGNRRGGILVETTTPAPVNDYGVTKLAMEHVAALYSERLPIIITRPFNYTGVGQGSEFIIPKLVAHFRDRATVVELGNLDVARDFSDVRSVVDAYARLLAEPSALSETFNISSGDAVSLGKVIEMLSNLSGHRLQVRVNPAFVRANEVRSLCGSAAKLEGTIGPLRQIALEETLRWMLED
jgi:nucleoside-diphosphate-sugar epimerase